MRIRINCPSVVDPAEPAAVSLGLRQAFSRFIGHDSPRVLIPLTAAAVLARAGLGGWKRRDLGIAAGILAAEPFTEWVIHVFVLHFRPRTVRGRAVDPAVARKHRAHHADPRDEDLIFVPMGVLRLALPAAVVGWGIGERDARRALTGIATSWAMLTTYEWTHFLIHSSYRPRHSVYRRIWRAHRLHHFRNENYWFGVTTHLGDRILGTFPDRDAVPRSATARTLGVNAA